MQAFGVFLLMLPVFAQTPEPAHTPESLHYSLNWPSGLSLGELSWSTSSETGPDNPRFSTSVTLEAAVPAFPIRDDFRATASRDLCAASLTKQISHGGKKSEETTTFESGKATRETKNGGKTEYQSGACARDALSFIQFVRRELAAGRIPPPQTVYFGAPYQVKLDYGGASQIVLGGERKDVDRLVGSIKGPASQHSIELFFSRDPARTLISARVPLPLGTLSLELTP